MNSNYRVADELFYRLKSHVYQSIVEWTRGTIVCVSSNVIQLRHSCNEVAYSIEDIEIVLIPDSKLKE